jgi:uncharacterized protein YdaL
MPRTKVSLRLSILALLASVAGCSESGGPSVATTRKPASPLQGEGSGAVGNQFPFELKAIPHRAAAAVVPSAPAPALAAAVAASASTLVLYDTTGTWGWLGELYAAGIGTLVSHFGGWTSKPVSAYQAGDMNQFTAVVYVGSTFDEPIPAAFLQDVIGGSKPVVWLYDNVWQLADYAANFSSTYGFVPDIFDTSSIAEVDYKGTALTRYAADGSGIMTYSVVGTPATSLADAVRSDGTKFPWAVRGRNVTYIGENPLSYMTANDRYIAFCDMLFDVLAPDTAERHRALVRLEDVDSTADATTLRQFADYLSSQGVPFSVATIPEYTDPLGVYNGGTPETVPMHSAPAVASALRYMVQKGGTLVMHGYTHQYSNVDDPYTGVTADDCEFYMAHVDSQNSVDFDGPVAGDSQTWAAARVSAGLAELALSRLPTPTMFEFPHYAGSDLDALAVRQSFSTVYHRGLYFGGVLSGASADYTHSIGLFVPYVVTDPYGFKMIPENLGNYEPEPLNNNPARLAADLVLTAQINHVVRDGVASFFFHPYYPLSELQTIVAGVKAAGYQFVAATDL